MDASRCRLIILAHLRGLIKPYYTQGTRSILAENIILDAISKEQQAKYLSQRILADAAVIPALDGAGVRDMYGTLSNRFETLWGLFFNQVIDVKRVEDRIALGEQATRLLKEGKLGKAPKNLDWKLKLSPKMVEELRRDGTETPDWFIRTADEQKQYEAMMEEYEAGQLDKDTVS